MNEPKQELASLKQLQQDINSAFDQVYAAYNGATTVKDVAQARSALTRVSQKATIAAQGPLQRALELAIHPLELSAITICLELGIDGFISKNGSASLEDLTRQTNADPFVIRHILRLASCRGYFEETSASTWSATDVTHVMALPSIHSWILAHSNKRAEMAAGYVSWLKEHKYKQAWTEDDNPTKNFLGTDLWTWYGQHPEESAHFDMAMKMQEQLPPEMVPVYPLESTKTDEVLLVDVGGGVGGAIMSIRKQFPNLKGRVIVQDLPKTISILPKSAPFESMIHDFFTPQPVVGAKYYHFRRIFHDWHDIPCLKILQAIKPGMKPGFSKLLIHDIVLPDHGADFFDAGIDILMMTTTNGLERTENEWKALLTQAGFIIDKIWLADVGRTGIIEASVCS